MAEGECLANRRGCWPVPRAAETRAGGRGVSGAAGSGGWPAERAEACVPPIVFRQQQASDSTLQQARFEQQVDRSRNPLLALDASGEQGCMDQKAVSFLELTDVLEQVLLPLVDFRSLAVLACSCMELRKIVSDCPLEVWESAARRTLPRAHSLRQPVTRSSLQAAVHAYSKTMRNIRDGDTRHYTAARRGCFEVLVWRSDCHPLAQVR
ncbi:hypothetical protein WJX73_009977 [Symbiochloris irregularis]|uniref:F-box domain-containing protein n=1 Tax=Symbiochloris irregularis TaxID=706552 RepID=A0AAW1PGV9_9CHLO